MSLTKKLLLKCKSKYMVKFLTNNTGLISDALESTFDLKNAKALIACLEPAQYIKSLSYVMTVDIAKYIVESYTKLGFDIDYTAALSETPCYADYHFVDLAINSYFIIQGGIPDIFNDDYLRELYAYDAEVRAKLIYLYGNDRWA